ncbi:hypothetical protein AB0D04_25875 [Streptomyces sp. NPDC048483]|uniref:hypothetical protein n=1 Tax=Streptomyces sp. NPDC048483 TaxID=3154927 RepID=UPI0034333026
MGSSFFVSADQQHGASWPFSTEQLIEAVTRLWPGSDVAGALDDFLELDIQADDRSLPFSWQVEYQVLIFPDQDPLSEPAQIVHRLLRELAPGIPAVWWTEFDATLEPIDLSPDPEPFIRQLAG